MRSSRGNRASRSSQPTLWAFGGGKGGVGKTVVASSLAVAFARRGRRCVIVDADLGAANLHTVLGVPRPRRSLSDFLTGDVKSLASVACETTVPGLRIVSGAGALLDAANPSHARKQKLLRHLHTLEADDVFVDLSAGCSFNVLDLFLEARHGVLVVTPEPTSIENAYHFLKMAWLRSLRAATERPAVREAVQRALGARKGRDLKNPLALVADVALVDANAARVLAERAHAFAPKLVVNQAASPPHRHLGKRIAESCRDSLGASIEALGALDRDENVRSAVGLKKPVLEAFPECHFTDDVLCLADLLLPPPVAPARVLGPAVLDLSRPGSTLRQRREALGLDLGVLSRRTRIRSLGNLETERYDQLPPEPYVRGYVRLYAQELGIRDAEALAESFVARLREFRLATSGRRPRGRARRAYRSVFGAARSSA